MSEAVRRERPRTFKEHRLTEFSWNPRAKSKPVEVSQKATKTGDPHWCAVGFGVRITEQEASCSLDLECTSKAHVWKPWSPITIGREKLGESDVHLIDGYERGLRV